MIQPHELRIGNWVQIKCKPVKVESIYGDLINIELGEDEFKFYPTIEGNGNYEPIPLTPEILKAAGFRKLINAWVPLDYNVNEYIKWQFTIYDYGYSFRYNSSEYAVELKHLHQLQNLYFALTGKELEINLK